MLWQSPHCDDDGACCVVCAMLVHLYFSVPRRNIRGAIFIFTCARCDVRVYALLLLAEGELDDM